MQGESCVSRVVHPVGFQWVSLGRLDVTRMTWAKVTTKGAYDLLHYVICEGASGDYINLIQIAC